MYLIAGLGNPEGKYAATRHNVGFEAAECLRKKLGCGLPRIRFHADIAQGKVGTENVLVVRPLTYMNLSGTAIREIADFYKIAPDHVIVMCDDVSIPFGHLRLRPNGSAGGHNGLKNIIYHLNSEDFPRVKIGVGKKPRPDYDLAAWVLGKFPAEDQKAIDKACEDAVNAAACIIAEDCAAAAQKFNGKRI